MDANRLLPSSILPAPDVPSCKRFVKTVRGNAKAKRVPLYLAERFPMFLALFIILAIIWLICWLALHITVGAIHILIVLAVLALIVHLFHGRRTV